MSPAELADLRHKAINGDQAALAAWLARPKAEAKPEPKVVLPVEPEQPAAPEAAKEDKKSKRQKKDESAEQSEQSY